MKKTNKELTTEVITEIKLPVAIQEKLMAKLMDKHEDKILEMLQVRSEYVRKIREIDAEVMKLTSVYGKN